MSSTCIKIAWFLTSWSNFRMKVCLAERSSPEQMKAIREEASTSGTALSKSAEPKEAEIVQEGKEPREEHYNPVMW